jgi:hypothetical protein
MANEAMFATKRRGPRQPPWRMAVSGQIDKFLNSRIILQND